MQMDDAAEYSCMVANQYGQSATSARVLPKDQYDMWLQEMQSKGIQESKQNVMTELDSTVQQGRKPKPGFVTTKTEKMLQQKYETNGTAAVGGAAEGVINCLLIFFLC